jgi:predicted peptidase
MTARQSPQLFKNTKHSHLHAQYLLFLPQGYDPRQDKSWPLMLCLHGSGERGSQVRRVAAHGPPKVVAENPDFPFILVSPQCPRGAYWSTELLVSLLDDVVEKHRVDSSRVYVTGLSMGGYGAWSLAVQYPERFAAIAPVCGGGDVLPILLAEPRGLKALKSLGVWAFHGEKDPVVPVEESQRMIAALQKIGNPAKLTLYPDLEHDCWTATYNNPALYKWFLSHRRRRGRSG